VAVREVGLGKFMAALVEQTRSGDGALAEDAREIVLECVAPRALASPRVPWRPFSRGVYDAFGVFCSILPANIGGFQLSFLETLQLSPITHPWPSCTRGSGWTQACRWPQVSGPAAAAGADAGCAADTGGRAQGKQVGPPSPVAAVPSAILPPCTLVGATSFVRGLAS
jgi:hypothetical protein